MRKFSLNGLSSYFFIHVTEIMSISFSVNVTKKKVILLVARRNPTRSAIQRRA